MYAIAIFFPQTFFDVAAFFVAVQHSGVIWHKAEWGNGPGLTKFWTIVKL
jgi:hypothetical protein